MSTGVFKMRNGMDVVVDNTARSPKPEIPEAAEYLSATPLTRAPEMKNLSPISSSAGRSSRWSLAWSSSSPVLQAMSSLNVRQYPRSDIASVTVTTVYVGASAELVRGFHHHAAGARDRRRGRNRLSAIAKHAGRLHHHGAAEAELRLEQSALGDQLEGKPGARRPAAGSGDPGHQHRVGRFTVSRPPISASPPTFCRRTRSPIISTGSSSRG